MFYEFPPGTKAVVVEAYQRPYEDPLADKAGAPVAPDRTRETDLIGWVWCRGRDGREGWTPERWLGGPEGCTLLRDFSAIELTVSAGDRLTLINSESGFIWCEAEDGRLGWVPDAVLELQVSSG